jgi:hypothetical protein
MRCHILAFPTSALPAVAHQLPRVFDLFLIQAEERLRAASVFVALLTEEALLDEPGDRVAGFADAPVDVLLEESPPRDALKCVGGVRVAQKIGEHVDRSFGNLCLPRTRRHQPTRGSKESATMGSASGEAFIDENENPSET